MGRWRWVAGIAAGGAVAAATAWALREVVESIGERGDLEWDERVADSPQFHDGVFHNAVPAAVLPPGATLTRENPRRARKGVRKREVSWRV